MKHNIAIGRTTCVLSLCAMFVVSTVLSAHARQCSIAGAAGTYGFTASGTLFLPTGPVPLAAVGRASFNADGSFSGTEARSVGGQFANETLGPGTWSVNPDCTGTLISKVFESGVLVRTSVLYLVFDDNMREGRAIQQSFTLPDGSTLPAVVTFETRRLFEDHGQD